MNILKMFQNKNREIISENEIVSVMDGELIDVAELNDPTFSQKLMGESVAIRTEENQVTICSPAAGVIEALFPTGHAFGVRMKNGIEILVHIGIDSVEAEGDGFELLNKKQGDDVQVGEPIVKVDFGKLRGLYEMTVIIILTNTNGHNISFIDPSKVALGQKIVK